MAIRISKAAARAACDTINAFIDQGSAPGILRIYEGSRPASVDTAISTQTVLVELALPDPCFGAAVDATLGGHATANAIDAVTAAATGTASFFRVFDGDEAPVFDGDVTDTSGNGDLKLSSVAVIEGIDVTVVSFTTTMPIGA